MTGKEAWYESDDPRRIGWGIGRWVLVVLIGIAVLSAAVWGIGVLTSDVHGRGEQRKQINRADNRIFAQELFRELHQDIQAYDAQVGTTAAQVAVTSDPAERNRLNAVLLGLRNQCISTVRQYDAEALKVSRERFRDADLPAEIDQADPNFDCKETA